VVLGGFLDADPRDVQRIELRSDEAPPMLVPYNCIYRSFVAIHQIPEGFSRAVEQVWVTVTYRDGREFELVGFDRRSTSSPSDAGGPSAVVAA
jgi:hypothetical protein